MASTLEHQDAQEVIGRMLLLDSIQQAGAKIGAYRNVAWLVAAIVVLGGVLLRFGARLGPVVVASCAGAMVSLVCLAVALVLYRRAIAPPYRWVSAEYVYKFDADDLRRQTQVIKIRIKANRDNVTEFHNSYYWTGDGSSDIRVVGANGHKVCQTEAKDSGRRNYYVHLGRPLSRNEETVIHLEQTLFDANMRFQPILAKKVSEPVDKLTLRVVFPRSAQPTTITKARQCRQTGQGQDHWRSVRTDEVEWNHDERSAEVTYCPPSPRTGHRYELDWEPWEIYQKTGQAP
jgi:hypothetical protein